LVDKLAPDDVYDYVLVVVRKNQVRELLPALKQNRSPAVVFMVNTAAGPEEWIAALGAERVMLGFGFAGGRREGSLIRAIHQKRATAPFGEACGKKTERLARLVGALSHAGLKAKASTQMPDWLATHASMVAPLALLILKHGCDTAALARDKQDMRRLAGAMRETLAVLRATNHRVVPASAALVEVLPRWVVQRAFGALLASRFGQIGAGWHCSQAPDEMTQLAHELKELVERSGLAAPTLRELLAAV
jgi:2-dehydropantoate 2-reductase